MKRDTRGSLGFKVEKPSCLVQHHATSVIQISYFYDSDQGCRAVENSLNKMHAHQTLKTFIGEKRW